MKPKSSFRATLFSLALAASALFVPTLAAEAQEPSAKKTRLRDVTRENYGSKRDVPAAAIFSLDEPVKPFNPDQHIELLNSYKSNYMSGGIRRSIRHNDLTCDPDTLIIGLSVWDKENGYKGVFTYDAKNDVIDIHNAGMDGSNKAEWRFAAGAMFGFRLPSEKVAINYAEQGFDDMKKRFPHIEKGKTALRFMGFSCGAPVAIIGAFGMAAKGHKIDQVVLIDPFAAAYAIRSVDFMVRGKKNRKALTDFIDQRCMTMTPIGGSFVDKIPPPGKMAFDFGRVEKVDAGEKGHHHFISNYIGKYVPYRAPDMP